jgi:hypothetical protein
MWATKGSQSVYILSLAFYCLREPVYAKYERYHVAPSSAGNQAWRKKSLTNTGFVQIAKGVCHEKTIFF